MEKDCFFRLGMVPHVSQHHTWAWPLTNEAGKSEGAAATV